MSFITSFPTDKSTEIYKLFNLSQGSILILPYTIRDERGFLFFPLKLILNSKFNRTEPEQQSPVSAAQYKEALQ